MKLGVHRAPTRSPSSATDRRGSHCQLVCSCGIPTQVIHGVRPRTRHAGRRLVLRVYRSHSTDPRRAVVLTILRRLLSAPGSRQLRYRLSMWFAPLAITTDAFKRSNGRLNFGVLAPSQRGFCSGLTSRTLSIIGFGEPNSSPCEAVYPQECRSL